VQRDGLAGVDKRVEHANRLIFEEQPVILGCRRQGIQVLCVLLEIEHSEL
jgi:hypothetical protein